MTEVRKEMQRMEEDGEFLKIGRTECEDSEMV